MAIGQKKVRCINCNNTAVVSSNISLNDICCKKCGGRMETVNKKTQDEKGSIFPDPSRQANFIRTSGDI